MRAPLAIAVSLAGLIAGATAVCAADLSPGILEQGSSYQTEPGRPAGQILIYDYEPGVVLREWWLPPWRGRHYFPFGSVRPAALRPAKRLPPERAEPFERSWSTCSLCDRGEPATIARPRDELPPLLLMPPERRNP